MKANIVKENSHFAITLAFNGNRGVLEFIFINKVWNSERSLMQQTILIKMSYYINYLY